MASKQEKLEEVGRQVMAASVGAKFLGLLFIVDLLDHAFSEVVRMSMVWREAEEQRATEAEEG